MPNLDIGTLLDIGIALSKERNGDKLFEKILDVSMDITNCDAGTLYVVKDDALHFKIMVTKSFGIRLGADGEAIDLPPVSLSAPNVSSRAAKEKTPVNIADLYENTEFDFAGTKAYDERTGYKSVSMLSVPMEDDYGDVIGVMLLINALDGGGRVVPFAKECERVILSLASQAAICLTARNYAAEVSELLNSFVRVMSAAIDARSPYTANHTKNMAKYARKFVEWLNAGGLSGTLAFDELRAKNLYMSLWLHDIGKLAVPLEIMDKESRLGPKLEMVRHRLQVLEMQAKIDFLQKKIGETEFILRVADIEYTRQMVEEYNKAGFLSEEMMAEIRGFGEKAYLAPDELECLLVQKGTLTATERRIMEGHVSMTRRILSEMNFPKRCRPIPIWASEHHEFLNGKGYPDRLANGEIPVEARILTIIDIYEALTAADRPYKAPMPPEKAFGILDGMAENGQIDAQLLDLFKQSGAWEE